jgi:hypothetical protein
VGDAIAFQRVDQRAGDRLLPDHIQKSLRSIAAGQDGVALGGRFLGHGSCFLLGHDPWLTPPIDDCRLMIDD